MTAFQKIASSTNYMNAITELEPGELPNSQIPSHFQLERFEPSKDSSLDYKKEILLNLDTSGLIDTHCHLDFIFDRLQQPNKMNTLKSLKQHYNQEFPKSFSGCVAVFCEPKKWGIYGYENAILDTDHDVWFTFGVHPHHSDDFDVEVMVTLQELLKRDRVVALGEIGLDYSQNNHVDHSIQQKTFLAQVHMALQTNLPLCLHIRLANEDGLRILDEANLPQNYLIHLHCFNSTWEDCEKWMATYPNLKVGFTPMISYVKNQHLHEVVKKIPLHRILLETDSPYFLPRQEPTSLSGISHPGFVIHAAAQIAQLKSIPIQDVIEANRRNVLEVYGIAVRPPKIQNIKPYQQMAIKKESDRDGFPLQNLHQPDHSPKIRSTKPYPEVAIKKESNRDDFYSQSQYQPDRPPKITKPYQQQVTINKEPERDDFPSQNEHQPDRPPKNQSTKPYQRVAIKNESDRDDFPSQSLHQPVPLPKIQRTKPYQEVAIKKESNQNEFPSQNEHQPDLPQRIQSTKPYPEVINKKHFRSQSLPQPVPPPKIQSIEPYQEVNIEKECDRDDFPFQNLHQPD